jgi:hypothetical protein
MRLVATFADRMSPGLKSSMDKLKSFSREGQRAGEEVELPRDEVLRLRGLGYLVDPSAKEIPVETGQTHAGRLTLK